MCCRNVFVVDEETFHVYDVFIINIHMSESVLTTIVKNRAFRIPVFKELLIVTFNESPFANTLVWCSRVELTVDALGNYYTRSGYGSVEELKVELEHELVKYTIHIPTPEWVV